MNDPMPPSASRPQETNSDLSPATLGTSTLYKLFEAFIGMREKNDRQHKVFDQTLVKTRDALQASFNSFAADTQRAYQQLRQEIHGEKRISLALLNELLDIGCDLEHIGAVRPSPNDSDAVARWFDAVEIQTRKVQDAVRKHGIQPYDAAIGSLYNPALHERVGSRRVEGMDALRIAEQRERGYASQQPEFVLRRPKVIITE
jgi:molecular chaperone GrpE (heat shock protein)